MDKPQSWWTTLPGILTGLAAVITAVTGLILVFNPVNSRSTTEKPSQSPQPSQSAQTSGPGPSSPAASHEIPLPSIAEVKLNSGERVIRILKVVLEPYNVEKRALKFT